MITVLQRQVKIVSHGKTLAGTVTIGPIVRQEDGRYACGWSVSYLHEDPGKIIGDDAIQSIERCLQFLGTFLEGSAVDGVDVLWQCDGDSGGIVSRLPSGERKR